MKELDQGVLNAQRDNVFRNADVVALSIAIAKLDNIETGDKEGLQTLLASLGVRDSVWSVLEDDAAFHRDFSCDQVAGEQDLQVRRLSRKRASLKAVVLNMIAVSYTREIIGRSHRVREQ